MKKLAKSIFRLLGFFSIEDFSQVFRLKYVWPNWQGEWILGRHACLGRDVISLSGEKFNIFNVQKGRVDFLLSKLESENVGLEVSLVEKYLKRKDIIPLLRQQQYFKNLPRNPPSFIYMDSYSELVDQLFIHKKDGWKFCCCYDDIDHSQNFLCNFEEAGLLSIDQMEFSYRNFFNFMALKYGNIPIFFLHFPAALEHRPKFLERSNAILEMMKRLVIEYPNLHPIAINENDVSWPESIDSELRGFPYHYNKVVYFRFSELLITLIRTIDQQKKPHGK